jgi:3-phenylpropionate/trans-cinnamate dioxygenase ferredoxin subunit
MKEYHKVARVGEVRPGEMKPCEAGGRRVALCNTDGRLYAVGDACTHAGARLSEGWLYDGRIECALHGALFDAATGAALAPPARGPLPTYEVKVEGEDVYVALSTG